MHTKFERLLSKSLTILEVMAYYLVVHTGLDPYCLLYNAACTNGQITVQKRGVSVGKKFAHHRDFFLP